MENGQYYPYPSDTHSYIRYREIVRGVPCVAEVHNHDYFMRIYDTQSGEHTGVMLCGRRPYFYYNRDE